jgi:hypothetical protein
MRNFVYNPGQVVPCSGCSRDVKGIQRLCKGCDSGVLCHACWAKSGTECVCKVFEDVTPFCADCETQTRTAVSATAVSEKVFNATVESLTVINEVCLEFIVEPTLAVACMSVGLTLGLAAGVLTAMTYPIQVLCHELVNTVAV